MTARPTMPAISLWQPYASGFLLPEIKRHETRHWRLHPSRIGQRVAIHAACRVLSPAKLGEEVEEATRAAFGSNWRKTLPFGAFAGSVVLGDCREMGLMIGGAEPAHDLDRLFGLWEPGRFAFRGDDPITLPTPIKAQGRQGWFKTDLVQP